MSIIEILSRNVEKYSDETSLIERRPDIGNRREITWLEFDKLSNKLANALIAKGIGRGDKVVLLMMNCLEWLPIYFGILKTGALAVPLNFRFTADEIYKCTETAEAKILIYGPEFRERIEEIKSRNNNIEHFIYVGQQSIGESDSFYKLITQLSHLRKAI
ncbi:MAG: class I adenylate-forming enzyme family protein [Clostridia bacterium]|nr:class I adenylate-forming enzyme family protein [Clostridia bacterium]